jgi:hypothetical protein
MIHMANRRIDRCLVALLHDLFQRFAEDLFVTV